MPLVANDGAWPNKGVSMQTTILSLIAILLLAPVGCSRASGEEAADRSLQLEDPMFGLVYDAAKLHYDPMPASIRRICPDFNQGTFWTYAHIQRGPTEYFVVMGVGPDQSGDSLGGALEVTGSRCSDGDSLQMLSGFVPVGGYGAGRTPPGLPGGGAKRICERSPFGPCHYVLRSAEEEMILRDLVKDALVRATRAWGSAGVFRQQACKPSHLEKIPYTPIVREELARFCSQE